MEDKKVNYKQKWVDYCCNPKQSDFFFFFFFFPQESQKGQTGLVMNHDIDI